MKKIDSNKFKSIIIKAFELLNEKRDVVDSLNVFPVPDGDTGTNMTMTMKSGVERVKDTETSSCYDVAKALSQGTLMGARGNSGVILSQLCRGMSKAIKGKDIIDAESIRDIFTVANKTAYKAVMKPTEGTILTVSRLMAEEANNAFENNIDIDKYLYKIIAAGHKALLDTPNLLPVLKEAKVVDSGGQGLMFLLEGALKALNGEIDIETDLSEIEIEDLPSKDYNIDLSISISEDGKDDLLEKLKPYNLGGDMIEYVYEQESTFAKPAQKFEAGTQDVGGVVGLSAAIDFMNEIGVENIYNHENKLARYAYQLIKDIDNIKVFFPEKRNTGSVVAFTFDDIHPHDVATILDMKGIAVRSGHHCAMPLHTYLDVSSTCRASFAIYNTKEEVEYFAKELKNVRKVMGL